MTDARTLRTAASYTARADEFEQSWTPVLRPMAERALLHLDLRRARLVLDIGCGTGGLLATLQAHAPAARVVGIDVSEGMLAIARRRDGGVALVVGDSHELALRDGCADAAIYSFVLHRLLEPTSALAQAARILRPGGRVATVSWGHSPRSPISAIWQAETVGLAAAPAEQHGVDHHGLVDEPEKVALLIRSAGLTPVNAWRESIERPRTADEAFSESMWSARRLESLPDAERQGRLDRVRRGIGDLSPGELMYHAEVVYAVGLRP